MKLYQIATKPGDKEIVMLSKPLPQEEAQKYLDMLIRCGADRCEYYIRPAGENECAKPLPQDVQDILSALRF